MHLPRCPVVFITQFVSVIGNCGLTAKSPWIEIVKKYTYCMKLMRHVEVAAMLILTNSSQQMNSVSYTIIHYLLIFLNSTFFQCEHSRRWPSVPRLHATVVNAQIGLRPVGL